jgi:uracil-DNA glycosylase
VPGEGQISAKLIFIGEAPGKNKDENENRLSEQQVES